jgi:hypothetical protein
MLWEHSWDPQSGFRNPFIGFITQADFCCRVMRIALWSPAAVMEPALLGISGVPVASEEVYRIVPVERLSCRGLAADPGHRDCNGDRCYQPLLQPALRRGAGKTSRQGFFYDTIGMPPFYLVMEFLCRSPFPERGSLRVRIGVLDNNRPVRKRRRPGPLL